MGVRDRYSVKPVDRGVCKEWLLKKHYARRWAPIKFCFGLFDEDNVLRGICCFGTPPRLWNKGGSLFGGRHVVDVWELNRLCIEDGLERNVGSFFVSGCLKLLRRPFVVVSYADRNLHHCGYVYQASNFMYTGVTDVKYSYLINGSRYHWRTFDPTKYRAVMGVGFDASLTLNENVKRAGGVAVEELPKHRYVFVEGRNRGHRKVLLQDLIYRAQPYPKEESRRYDSSYRVTVQTQLF